MDQFENLANFNVHFNSTGPELWRQTNGTCRVFVMSAGPKRGRWSVGTAQSASSLQWKKKKTERKKKKGKSEKKQNVTEQRDNPEAC